MHARPYIGVNRYTPQIVKRNHLLIAAGFGLSGVILGAFGAHGLERLLGPEQLESFGTGVDYQLLHAVVLLFTAMLAADSKGRWPELAFWLFVAGIVCFSGSIYLLATREILWAAAGILWPVTPLGGLLLMAGWIALALHAFQSGK